MKQRLVILSDLWGNLDADWVKGYFNNLSKIFDVIYYDCCVLGEINLINYSEQSIHTQFIEGGIDTAVKNLLVNEKEEINILSFSIGGIIAWKAALLGLKVNTFYAVSSTRLRYEKERPKCVIHLFFGALDKYRPSMGWYKKLSITSFSVFKNENHNLYKSSKLVESLCIKIITDLPANF